MKLKNILKESHRIQQMKVYSNPYARAFSPIVEEDEGEVNVGGYQTQHFDVCPAATALYKDIESKGVDMDLAARTAKLQDVLYFIEKHVEEEGYQPDAYYGEVAQILGDQIMTMAGMMDLGSEHSYIQGHIDRIQSVVQGGSVNEAKNIKVTFHSTAAKNRWMRKQKLKPNDKEVVSQDKSSLVLTPDMKDYVSKKSHGDLIYQVDMVNEAVKRGKRYGDWAVTQYEPVQYDDYGAPYGGRIKIVNQKTGHDLLIQNDLAVRGRMWYVSVNRVSIKNPNPEKVIQQAIKKFDV